MPGVDKKPSVNRSGAGFNGALAFRALIWHIFTMGCLVNPVSDGKMMIRPEMQFPVPLAGVVRNGAMSNLRKTRHGEACASWMAMAWAVWVIALWAGVESFGNDLVINEFMASNGSSITDEDGDTKDWIELYNMGLNPVNLAGYGLSDNPDKPFKWVFPDVTIEAGEFLLVFASGKDRRVVGSELHTSFSISDDGEPLCLTDSGGLLLDSVGPLCLPCDVSFGRQPDGSAHWLYFEKGTPGLANNAATGYLATASAPNFSHAEGWYDEGFALSLSTEDTNGIIYFTLDGSDPSPDDVGGRSYCYKNLYPVHPGQPFGELLTRYITTHQYTNPIAITDRSMESNDISLINTWFKPAARLPSGLIPKATVVRSRVFKTGALPSPVVTHTYFVGDQTDRHGDLLVLSVVADERSWFDYEDGIYVPGAVADAWRAENPESDVEYWQVPGNFYMRGDAWERPAHIGVFEAGAGLVYSQNLGVCIHGGSSRANYKKALRLCAGNGYNPINYPFFPDLAVGLNGGLPIDSFQGLVLRYEGNFYGSSLIRDALVHELVRPLGLDVLAYRPAVEYINGEYWGICGIRERHDEHYLASHYGLEPDEIAIVSGMWNILDVVYGTSTDADDYLYMVWLAISRDLSAASNFALIENRLDPANLAHFCAVQVYVGNMDLESNMDYWRKRTTGFVPDAQTGHDGRWRWMVYDMDSGFHLSSVTNNMLGYLINHQGTFGALFRKMLANDGFRYSFINTLADQMNSTFQPDRVSQMVDALNAPLVSEFPKNSVRWPGGILEGEDFKAFAEQRPAYVRQHVVDQFSLAGTAEITLAIGSEGGRIKLNSLVIDGDMVGHPDPENPYPWTGTYFQGVPVRVTALPDSGYRFVGWQEYPDETSGSLELTPEHDMTLTALFEKIPPYTLLHYWNFNDTTNLMVPTFSVGGGSLAIDPGAETEIKAGDGQGFAAENAQLDDEAGSHLRINNPLGAVVQIALPTLGYKDVVVRYETRRSGSGAGEQRIEYSLNGVDFTSLTAVATFDASPVVHEFNFQDVPGVSDNRQFALRIGFETGDGGTAGNNRFDNLTVEGRALRANNSIPVVKQSFESFRELIEGGVPITVNLDDVFSDSDGDSLNYEVQSVNSNVVRAGVSENILTLTPVTRGETTITVTADDRTLPSVSTTMRVLVYPSAHKLSSGAFTFVEWDSNQPDGAYPEHMLFLQSEQDDTVLDTALLHAYSLSPGDYHQDDSGRIGHPYGNTCYTRINGLGSDGISFVNTGQARDLGGALLAVDASGMKAASIGWLAGTVTPNERIYALRLQYRVGTEGAFKDVFSNGRHVEYVMADTAGHSTVMPAVALPADALGQEYVQLLWRYYRMSGDSGDRAELRLDEVAVRGYGPFSVTGRPSPDRGGVVSGGGIYEYGQTATLTATPNPYFRFSHWDGFAPAGSSNGNPISFIVDAGKQLTARFTADATTNTETPFWWLIQHGLTNVSFEEEALRDHNGNGLCTWVEYVADLDPTNTGGQLPLVNLKRKGERIVFELDQTSTARLYAIEATTNLAGDLWISITNSPGTGSSWEQEWNVMPENILIFKGRILVPSD